MAGEPISSGSMAVVMLVALLVIALVAIAAFSLIGSNSDGSNDDDGGLIDITIPAPTEGSSIQWEVPGTLTAT